MFEQRVLMLVGHDDVNIPVFACLMANPCIDGPAARERPWPAESGHD
jgi:hypothetical protein